MSFALSAGVTGLQAHQKMLDIAGNNLANVNTTAFKSSRITFSELLCETIKKASQPTSTVGGTNPQQMGSGVGVSGISPNMAQGNLINTGNPLDLAIEGEGYFVLAGSGGNVYTRAGAFGVDANSNLVDPATGYLVQRIGNTGEADGFQVAGVSDIHVPYDVTMEAKATSTIIIQGNLSKDATFDTPQIQVLASDITYTINNGTVADGDTELDDLDQFSGTWSGDATITVSGYDHDGGTLTDGTPLTVVADTTTLNDLISHINTVLGGSGTMATLSNGRIKITDDTSGYSELDIKLAYTDTGDDTTLTMPGYFEMTTVGGEEVKDISITTYDSLGGKHVLSGGFCQNG